MTRDGAFMGFISFDPSGSHVTTIGGWTPGLRALLAGRMLPCGCLIGIYQTASGELTGIIDATSKGCTEGHDANRVVWRCCGWPAPPAII
jgi:hypothetical protein